MNREEATISTLQCIARGRVDNGRPIAAEKSRQLARAVLKMHGIFWGSEAVPAKRPPPLPLSRGSGETGRRERT